MKTAFHYCPHCGSPQFFPNTDKSIICQDCGFTYFFNTAAAVACFIYSPDGKLLVARRALDPSKGTLDLPGGFIDPWPAQTCTGIPSATSTDSLSTFDSKIFASSPAVSESAEQACSREVYEETSIIIPPEDFHYLFSIPNIYRYKGICVHTLDLFFEARLTANPEFSPHDDVSALRFVPLSILHPSDFGLQSISQAIAKILSI